MVRCTNCQYTFKTKEVLAVGFAKHGKACPNCGVKQYISKGSQQYLSLGYVSLLFVLILPFFIKLSDREESVW